MRASAPAHKAAPKAAPKVAAPKAAPAPAAAPVAPAAPVAKNGADYTVVAGDSLSKIAKEHLGNGNLYMEIFNANKDVLTDPDKLKPGMVLKLPVAAT